MNEELTFEELYNAYILCLKNKKRKKGTYTFVNEEICINLLKLLNELNDFSYVPKSSNCYVITDPALREIYAAQFSDRIVQHFYMSEIENILEQELIDGCCSCRKGKGSDYALKLLKEYLLKISNNGKKDCYYLKVDLSGYFMSIDRSIVSKKFENLIKSKYVGKHKNLLLYLTPIIFENNPAQSCRYKCNEKLRKCVPERRKMNTNSEYGMAIGNLTSQAASNLNLSDFDKYVTNTLGLKNYVRYVDDLVIISDDKNKLLESLPYIDKKLEETHQTLSAKKTKVDTAYRGVHFLGKISYPYGYQKANKQVCARVCSKASVIQYTNATNLIEKTNAQIVFLKNYNCRKLIGNYCKLLPYNVYGLIDFNENILKFNFNK